MNDTLRGVRIFCCGLLLASLFGCFGKPPPEQKYLRVSLGSDPCLSATTQQHRLPMGFKPLTALENLDRTSVLTAQGQVLTANLQYYWEGAPQDIVGQILRQGIECRSNIVTPVDYQPRVKHDVVMTGQVLAFNVEEQNGGQFVVFIKLELWTKNLGAKIGSSEFSAYSPLANFRGETIARAASDAMARIVPKVVAWLDEGQPKLKKFLENK